MKNLNILTLISLALFVACESDTFDREQLDLDLMNVINRESPTGNLSYFILAQSDHLAALPQDPKNPLTPEKVELGSFLFFETGMGIVPQNENGMQSYSCGSCHVPAADFKPGRRQGIGEGGFGFGYKGESRVKHSAYVEEQMDVQGIRPLNVLNVAYSAENTLWNGSFGSTAANADLSDIWGVFDKATELNHLGYHGLETQNIEGLRVHRMLMTKELADELGYTSRFDAAFPDLPVEERYSNLAVSLAISAYLRTLTTTEAPFQKWLKGDMAAMSNEEKRGAMVFFNEGNCNTCHTSPAFSAVKFFALGVNNLDNLVTFKEGPELAKKNLGRGGFTGREADMFKFKVPTLYNLQGTPFYFHGSSKQSIEEVVEYFDKAIPENPNVPATQIASEFRPLGLSERQKADLVAFLKFGLQDPSVTRLAPSALPSGNCFPNADPLSKREIGCE
jgi:cytochrome c peroxidase